MPEPHPLIAELATRRREQGRTQLDVACEIGVAQGAVSFWEIGQRGPTLDRFTAYAEELGYVLTLTPKES